VPVAGRSAQPKGHSAVEGEAVERRPWTFALSRVDGIAFGFSRSPGALCVRFGWLSVSWLRVEFDELLDSYIDEVSDLPSLVERRVYERGVWN